MRIWNKPIPQSFHFTIASDSRFNRIDPNNDQIWEFHCASKEPPALTLHTTYGLRAQSMRILPQFVINEATFADPFEFASPPKLLTFLPNYFSLNFSLLEGIHVLGEVWVKTSQGITGRYQIQNSGNKVITLHFDLVMNLKPLDSGPNMSANILGTNHVLTGKTHDLDIVGMLSGSTSASQSPYPALSIDLQIVPGKSRTVQWALASTASLSDSQALAKSMLDLQWEAEIARLVMQNDSQTIEIHTGDSDWDFSLASAQRTANSLVLGRGENENIPAFVSPRTVDMGYSFAENGSGLIHQWKNQSAIEAYYLFGYLLPGCVEQARIILNFFLQKYQDTENKPAKLDQPILCTMAMAYFEASNDLTWVEKNLPCLETFIKCWFDPANDRDQDRFPEWQDLQQSGLEDNPMFSRWKPETQGLNINVVESPALSSLLYSECNSLLNLSKMVKDINGIRWIIEIMAELKKQADDCWNDKLNCYTYRDYETHIAQQGKLVAHVRGNETIMLKKGFSKPQRLLFQISGRDDTRRRFRIRLQGKKQRTEKEEVIDYFNLSWLQGRAYYTTNEVFSRLDLIETEGMNEDDLIDLFVIDHQILDISLLLPLWAQMTDGSRTGKLIERTILKNFWGEFGIPVSSQTRSELFMARPPKVLANWNEMVGKGLLRAGRVDLARDLLTKMMKAIVSSHKKYHVFHESYHAQTAEPSGDRDHIRGFPPLSLFLETLGVKYIYSDRVVISGKNPFPWPVTIKYKGTSLTRHEKDSVITFSSGHTITVSSPEPQEIRLVQKNIIEYEE